VVQVATVVFDVEPTDSDGVPRLDAYCSTASASQVSAMVTSMVVATCPTCHAPMELTLMTPRDDGGTEWHFRCLACKTGAVVREKPDNADSVTLDSQHCGPK